MTTDLFNGNDISLVLRLRNLCSLNGKQKGGRHRALKVLVAPPKENTPLRGCDISFKIFTTINEKKKTSLESV